MYTSIHIYIYIYIYISIYIYIYTYLYIYVWAFYPFWIMYIPGNADVYIHRSEFLFNMCLHK